MRSTATSRRRGGCTRCSTGDSRDREFIVGDYSIADIASYPWVLPDRQSQNMDDFPHLKRWKEAIKARPATVRAYEKAKQINPAAGGIRTEAERKILFGQTKDVV